MAFLFKLLFLLPFLFISAFGNRVTTVKRFGSGFSLGFGFGFGGHQGLGFAFEHQHSENDHNPNLAKKKKPDFRTKFRGVWKIDNKNAGVAAMQIQLMPNGKLVWFDTVNLGPSAVLFNPEWCLQRPNGPVFKDCYAHAIEYDPQTSTYRTLKLMTDPWCSSGGLLANGDLINTGGAIEGMRVIRTLSMKPNSEFQESSVSLAADRWYSSQQILDDGSFIVMGGRRSFSYDLVTVSNTLQFEPKKIDLPLLKETNDPKENNLYPFLYLLPDGNVYLFSNYKAIVLNPRTGQTVRKFPDLVGGARNYPSSAMSALLPLVPGPENTDIIPVEVIICGGNIRDAAKFSEFPPRTFIPAFKDCNRMVITDPNPTWDTEDMPSSRVMGDMLHLPTGDLLMLNGAKAGCSAWEAADVPNFTPVLYSPDKPKGKRFRQLKPSQIARMYHSTSALLPDGKILVAGSNPHQFYNFTSEFPTEIRVEKFSPPYLAPEFDKHRPIINENSDKNLKYGLPFTVNINLEDEVGEAGIKVTMIAPPFTTHGFSQNQRLIVVTLKNVTNKVIQAVAPPNARIAPAGYYLLFVVHRGVPSTGIWVHID